MNTKALKPFDLQRALAGDVVLTTCGNRITKVYLIDEVSKLVCVYDDISCSMYNLKYVQENFSMAPKKVTKWLNLYKDNLSSIWDTEEQADKQASSYLNRVTDKAIKIEYEE